MSLKEEENDKNEVQMDRGFDLEKRLGVRVDGVYVLYFD